MRCDRVSPCPRLLSMRGSPSPVCLHDARSRCGSLPAPGEHKVANGAEGTGVGALGNLSACEQGTIKEESGRERPSLLAFGPLLHLPSV